VRKLIYDYAGIALSDSKHDMVYSRLARRVRALKLANFADYLACCSGPTGARSGNRSSIR
jgi:chemotaxis methyl-accepting protein methylase